jgi:alpha-1,6-mannosyltransferase
MPIKTLHFTNYYHSRSGGIRTMYHALLQAAERRRRPMRLVVPAEFDRVESLGEFTRIYHLAAPRSPLFDSQYRLLLPHRFLLPFPSSIRRIIEDEQPDVIEICDKYALPWLAGVIRKRWMPRVGRPLLVGLSCERMDDNLATYVGPRWRGAASLFMKRVYRALFDRHIAVSSYVAEELLDKEEVAGERVAVLPMGVDTGYFGPQHRSVEARCGLLKKAGGTDRTRLLLYAGRLSPEKNIRLLVDMMLALANARRRRQAQDYRLLVAGRGPLGPWLQEQAQHLNGRIVLLGHLSDRKPLAELLANTDAFVHPNPREPFGIAPLEAMCSELPVVAPSQGGVMAYCGAQNAWLAEPDGPSFAASVRAVFGDETTRAVRVAEGRRTALAHNWSAIAEQFFDTYDIFHHRYREESDARLRFAIPNRQGADLPASADRPELTACN